MPGASPSRRATLARALGEARPFRPALAGAALLLACQSALTIVPPALVGAISRALDAEHVRVGHLLALAVVASVAVMLAALFGAYATVIIARISESLASSLRVEMYTHVLDQSLLELVATRGGDTNARLMNDTNAISSAVRDHGGELVRSALTVMFGLVAMAIICWQLALVTVVLLPGAAFVVRAASRIAYRTQRDVQDQYGEAEAFAQETLGISGHLLIRTFGRRAAMRSQFASLSDELRDREVQAAARAQWISVLAEAAIAVATLTFLGVGSALTSHGRLAFSDLLAFVAVAFGPFGSGLYRLGHSTVVVVGSLASWARIFELLDRHDPSDEAPAAKPLRVERAEIELDGATFTYPGQPRPALDRVTLSIEPGQLVALVGRSGAGKTTLTHLVARIIDPQVGCVRIDGQDLREVTVESLGAAIGVALQDPFLFHASIRENLRFARPEASDEQLLAALDAAYLGDLLERLPQGLDSIVGERGHRLSGGEKQRLSLARVILKDPPILVLDEATSHLDSESEGLVQLALARLFQHRTSIVIAHRFSTISTADKIVVLDRGRVHAVGTHAELVAQNGLYAHLHELQSYVEEAT